MPLSIRCRYCPAYAKYEVRHHGHAVRSVCHEHLDELLSSLLAGDGPASIDLAGFGAVAAAGDDSPTQKLPPITDTVRRRPPPPNVRELQGAELLRALADQLDADGLGGEDL